METLLVGLKHDKAIQLLKDLEELNLIELLKNSEQYQPDKKDRLSALKGAITSKMNEAEIEQQLQSIRNEWQRDI